MTHDFHVKQTVDGGWVVERLGDALVGFRRRAIAEAFGRALAHRDKVSLIVHPRGAQPIRYSKAQLTYAARI